ncbi:MAG: P-loop NTPase [Spirochaetota bacterium]
MNEKTGERALDGTRIGVLGKGGSGKTTFTVLLASVLQERGYEVVLLDADSTNIGTYMALGIERAPASLLEYFGGAVFGGGAVGCPVDDPSRLEDAEIEMASLPTRYFTRSVDGITYLTAGKIGEQGPGSGCDGPVAKIVRDVSVVDTNERTVTLIDFKAGFEDTARGAITGLDWAIVVVDPTVAAVHMAIDLDRTIKQIKSGSLPATSHLESPEMVRQAISVYKNARIRGLSAILNRVPDRDTERHLRKQLESSGLQIIGVFGSDPEIAQAWLTGSKVATADGYESARAVINPLSKAFDGEHNP